MTALNRLQHFETLPDAALLSAREVVALTGRSRSSLWRDVRSHRLPPPLKIGPNTSRWRCGDIRNFMLGDAR